MRAMRFSAGVHASGGFGVGGPIKPATQCPEPEEVVYLDSVVQFLRYYQKKNAAISGIFFHFLFVILVIAITEIRNTSLVAKETNLFISQDLMSLEELQGVKDITHFYGYISTVMKTCVTSRQAKLRNSSSSSSAAVTSGKKDVSQSAVAVNFVGVRHYKHITKEEEERADGSFSSSSDAEDNSAGGYLGTQAAVLGRRFFPYNLTAPNYDLDLFRPFDDKPLQYTPLDMGEATSTSGGIIKNALATVISPVETTNNISDTASIFFYSNKDLAENASTKKYVFNGYPKRINGRFYPATEKQYQMGPKLLKDFKTEAEVDAFVDVYRQGQFFRVGTKLVVLDAMFFEPDLGYFFHAAASLVLKDTGRVKVKMESQPFIVFSLSNKKDGGGFDPVLAKTITLLILDILLVFFAMLLFRDVYRRTARSTIFSPPTPETGSGSDGSENENDHTSNDGESKKRRSKKSKQKSASARRRRSANRIDGGCRAFLKSYGFWELYDIALALFALSLAGCHFYLLFLAESFSLGDMESMRENIPEIYSMRFLTEYSSFTATFETLRGWFVLTALLRTFYILQYMSRLAVVTETVLSSVHEIVGVLLVFALVITGFSMAGIILFGSSIPTFYTMFDAFTFFVQLMGSGELHDYHRYEDASETAPMFFLLYFFVAYFVLLNVIIGILAASFVTTVESFDLVRRADWSLEALAKDVKALWSRFPVLLSSSSSQTNKTSPSSSSKNAPYGEGDDVTPQPPKRMSSYTNSILSTKSILKKDQAAATSALGAGRRRRGVSFGSVSAGGETEDTDSLPDTDSQCSDDTSASFGGHNDDDHLVLVDVGSNAYDVSLAYQRLLSALDTINNKDPNRQMVTLQQLRSVARPFMTLDAVDLVFAKAQQQIGTSNGKIRHVRLSSRRIHRGEQLMAEVAAQHSKIQQVHEALLGATTSASASPGATPAAVSTPTIASPPAAISAENATPGKSTSNRARGTSLRVVSGGVGAVAGGHREQADPGAGQDNEDDDGEDFNTSFFQEDLQVGYVDEELLDDDDYYAGGEDDFDDEDHGGGGRSRDPLTAIVETLQAIDEDIEVVEGELVGDLQISNRLPGDLTRTINEAQASLLKKKSSFKTSTSGRDGSTGSPRSPSLGPMQQKRTVSGLLERMGGIDKVAAAAASSSSPPTSENLCINPGDNFTTKKPSVAVVADDVDDDEEMTEFRRALRGRGSISPAMAAGMNEASTTTPPSTPPSTPKGGKRSGRRLSLLTRQQQQQQLPPKSTKHNELKD